MQKRHNIFGGIFTFLWIYYKKIPWIFTLYKQCNNTINDRIVKKSKTATGIDKKREKSTSEGGFFEKNTALEKFF